jgi:hypothetical protein
VLYDPLSTTFDDPDHSVGEQRRITDELRPEYDFDYSKAVRGKYYRRIIEEGSNIIVLEPDVAKVFKDSAGVNEALRSLLDFTRATQRPLFEPFDRFPVDTDLGVFA